MQNLRLERGNIMLRCYFLPMRIISGITLSVFLLVQTAPASAFSDRCHIRAQAAGETKAAKAIGAEINTSKAVGFNIDKALEAFVAKDEFKEYELTDVLGTRDSDNAYILFMRHKTDPSKDLVVKKVKDDRWNSQIEKEEIVLRAYYSQYGYKGVTALTDTPSRIDPDDDCRYLFMRPNPAGSSLFDKISAGETFTPAQVRQMGTQLGEVLSRFHKINACVADIKPENIWICDDGTFMINDLGGAYLMEGHNFPIQDRQFQVPTNFVGRALSDKEFGERVKDDVFRLTTLVRGYEAWQPSSDIFLLAANMLLALTGKQFDKRSKSEYEAGSIFQETEFRGGIEEFFKKQRIETDSDWKGFFFKALGGKRCDDPENPRFKDAEEFLNAVKANASSQPVEDSPSVPREYWNIIEMFNNFDTGFEATLLNCAIKREMSGRIHWGTYILTDTKTGKKYVVQDLAPTFTLDAVENNLKSLIRRQQEADRLGLFNPGQPLEGWEKVHYYNLKTNAKADAIHYYVEDRRGAHVWRVMGFIDSKIYQKLNDISAVKDRLHVARDFGKAIAKFGLLVSCVPENEPPLKKPLADYHNRHRYLGELNTLLCGQVHCVSPGSNTPFVKMISGVRNGPYKDRIEKILEIFNEISDDRRGGLFLSLKNLRKSGLHGDLKINNVAFDLADNTIVKAFFDLDTFGEDDIWTTDVGDGGRSACLVIGEDIWEQGFDIMDMIRNPDMAIDKRIAEEIVEGYAEMIRQIREKRPDLIAIVPHYFDMDLAEIRVNLYRDIAIFYFELGLRFFMDFITEWVN